MGGTRHRISVASVVASLGLSNVPQQLHSYSRPSFPHIAFGHSQGRKNAAQMATTVGKFKSASGKLWEVS